MKRNFFDVLNINPEIIYLMVWLLVSFLVAFWLNKRYAFFQKVHSILVLLGGFLLFVVLHNVVYGIFQTYFDSHGGDEPFFFILSFISLGTAIALLFILLIKKFRR